jgi:hypothetical protein
MSENKNGQWKNGINTFQGYVSAKLENIEKRLDTIFELIEKRDDKLERLVKEVTILKVKAALISGGVALVISCLVFILKTLFFNKP